MKDKRILVFGGSGSLGKQLISRLAEDNHIVVFSRDEAKHWDIRNNIPSEWGVEFIVGDMRDYHAVECAIKRTQAEVIIIASALKQVDTCEKFPDESVKTNIVGVQNVVDACEVVQEPPLPKIKMPTHLFGDEAITAWIERERKQQGAARTVLMVSTDKACSPINVYGMCKAIAERIVTERARHGGNTKYIAVRYGNVLESRGSVIPLFRYQAEHGEAFTVTHDEMTRFVMTLDDSIDLIVEAVERANNGEMWIPKLQAMRIMDLAKIFSKRYKKPVKVVGIRPGEKIHEDLINEVESLRMYMKNWQYFVVKPAWDTSDNNQQKTMRTYTSEDDVLRQYELEVYLSSKGIFDGKFTGV